MRRALFFAVAALTFVASGCKGREQRRLDYANLAGSDRAEDRVAARDGLRAVLREDPDDTKVMMWLAVVYLRDGEREEAKALYREIAAKSKDEGEVATAKDHLARLDAAVEAPAASASAAGSSARGPAPAAIPIVLGKSAGGVAIGDDLAAVTKQLGPCTNALESPPARVCTYPERGLDVGLRDDKVVRIGLYRAGREVPAADLSGRRFAGYAGESAEGLRVGMTPDELTRKFGEPVARYRPFSSATRADGGTILEVRDYSPKGFAVEIDLDVRPPGVFVGAILLPKAGLVGPPLTGKGAP